MTDPLREWIDRAERALARAGVKTFEICATEEDAVTAEAIDGAVHALEHGHDQALGIRVIAGGIGFAATTEPGDPAIERLIASALAEARLVRPAAIGSFAPGLAAPALPPFRDPRATGRPRALLSELALALEAEALAADRAVARVRPSTVDEACGRFLIRTSAGLEAEDLYSRAFALIGAVAEGQQDRQIAYASGSAPSLEALGWAPLAARAAARATRRLGAGSFPTSVVPVLLAPEALAELVAAVLAALAGDAIDRGASFLSGALGQAVFGPALTLVDRPHDPELDGACRIDGEGLATQDRVLVESGRLVGILDDRESAARGGRSPGGHGLRDSALGRPHAGAHAPTVLPGGDPLDTLRRDAEGGLWIVELSGAHTINEITGELSLGAAGWALRGGAEAEPVEGVTIAGSLRDLLGPGVRLSLETEVHAGMRLPSALLPGVQVAGPDV